MRLYLTVEAEEPPRFESSGFSRGWVWHDQDDLPVALAAGVWLAIALVLFGAVLAGLVVVAVTALAWALWRRRPWVGRVVAPRAADLATDVSRTPGDLLDLHPDHARGEEVVPDAAA